MVVGHAQADTAETRERKPRQNSSQNASLSVSPISIPITSRLPVSWTA